MKKVIAIVFACITAGLARAEIGTTRYWTGLAGNNKWDDAGNYDSSGVPDPSSDDTLVFPDGARVTLDGGDADSCNIARHLYRMIVADGASDVVLTINVPQNGIVDIDGAIVPTGDSMSDDSYNSLQVVKKGAGLLQLNSDGKFNAGNVRYGTDYYSKFIVEEGTLRFPTNLEQEVNYVMYVGYLAVSNGATAFTGIGHASAINNLYGEGVVTNDSASTQTLRIDISGDFSGELGGHLAYNSRGRVMLRGTNSTMTGESIMITYNNNGGNNGVTGLAKIGRAYEPSSIGLVSNILSYSYGGKLLYLGDGERTDKTYMIRAAPNYLHIIDGGASGGLVWEGIWGQYDIGMTRLVLEGSNAVPCVMEGAIQSCYDKTGTTNFTFHISKEGSGTWQLRHNDETTMTGGFTVREGTLGFDTIGETNVVTSLGKATNLAIDYGASAWDETKRRPYAHTLGSLADGTTGTLEYIGTTNSYSSTRSTVISGTGVLKQSGTGALVMSGFSPLDANAATLVLDGDNSSTNNVAANVTDSESGGSLSVVKRGSGTWTITENVTFTGALSVEEDTLILKPNNNYTWFRWTWQERFDNGDTSTKRYVMGVAEFALYDAGGNRCNLNLSDRGTNYQEASEGYHYYPHMDDGGWFGLLDYDSWRYLQPGECSIGATAGYVRTYRVDPASVALYPSAMFDGASGDSYFSGYVHSIDPVVNRLARLSDPDSWIPVILRLPEGSPTVKYWDYAHTGQAGRGVKISKLEGSVDGIRWEPVCSHDCGDYSGKNSKWEFKNVAWGSEDPELPPGQEIRGTTTNEWSFLAGNPQVSVKAGAVLKAVGDVTLRKIKIDAATGGGNFDGFKFAADTQVEVVNLDAGRSCVVPVSFSNAVGVEDSSDWTWTFVSKTGRILRGSGAASEHGVRYAPQGFIINFR